MAKNKMNKAAAITLTGIMAASSFTTTINANEVSNTTESNEGVKTTDGGVLTPQEGFTFLSPVAAENAVSQKDNVVEINYKNGEKTKLTFLEKNLFRMNMEIDGEDSSFKDYAEPNNKTDVGRIQQQVDSSDEYSKPSPIVVQTDDMVTIATADVRLEIQKSTSLMRLVDVTGETEKVVWEETAPIQYKTGANKTGQTIQTLKENENENFYGGGTQNGRFAHKGQSINIKNENNWVSGGVASPNPFYWSTAGYGIIRNTFKQGVYDFGKTSAGNVITTHNEPRYDAYIFTGEKPTEILDGFYKVTGNPALFDENAFYIGHLNCYNRDEWTGPLASGGVMLEDGNRYREQNNSGNIINGGLLESLNGTSNTNDYKFSARAVIDGYVDNDMPFGWFLPNDGYGCGYGKSDTSLDENVDNLGDFTDYAAKYGVTTGLWTQSDLTPNPSQPIHLQRDFEKEVKNGGIRTLKTDVAWVGAGYSFGLNGIHTAYNIIGETGERANIVTLDGWAGTQRYGGIWTGDQTGGNWEYIRFHIPTYIGQSLSGNPNVSSDVDGIFGGSALITTRDIQWKSFTTMMLDMDGWGSYPKKPYYHGEDYTSINRMYLKLRSELMPYIYTTAYTSANLGDDANEKGKPQVRAMFLEYPEDPNAYGTNVQYQFMMGKNLLVAPVYQNTNMDAEGNDIRNGIYLPDNDQVWIDYFTGKQYQGGRTLNNFDAPVWKLPLFVKNGAIMPMYTENNNSFAVSETNEKGLDKTKRIVEFYPDAANDTYYDLIEDDGKTLDNTNAAQPVYGDNVKTHFTSSVADGVATLTAEASNGSYTGYDSNRDTTFVVNVSQEPTSIAASIGDTALTKDDFTVANSQAEFDEATGNVYFYNTAPNLNKYATEGSDFANQNITTSPKLYVKFAKTDVNKNAVTLTVNGFVNDGNLDKNEENTALEAPKELRAVDADITPTMIPLTWNVVEGATSYEVETDGVIQAGMESTSFNHVDLAYHSTHTYRVRAINANGYSAWSDPIEVTSALDPYRNVPKDTTLSWSYGDSWGPLKNALDYDYGSMFHSTNGDAVGKDFIIDMKKIYSMDRFEYTPRQDNKGNGTVQIMDVYTSIDGKNWEIAWEGSKNPEWTYSSSSDVRDTKVVDLTGNDARYIKLVVRKSKGGFFSAAELQPYTTEGATGRLMGDTNNDGVIDNKDLVQIQNYVGLEDKDATWDQVVKSDWNTNKYYDAFDIAVTTTQLNGGIARPTGNVEGSIQVSANKTSVKAGESVEFSINGIGLRNVYAFGVKLNFDNEAFSDPSTSAGIATMAMTKYDFSRVPAYDSGRNYNLVFTNIGDQSVLSGSKVLGKVKFTAKKDVELTEDTVKLLFANLVGNNLSEVNALGEGKDPILPETEKVISKTEISNITFSNDVSENINPAELWQQSDKDLWKDILFDGERSGNLAEFKWYTGPDSIKEVVKLPTDMSFTFNSEKAIKAIRVYNRNGSNGAVTSMKATAYSGETAYDLGTINEFKEIYTFMLPAEATAIDRVVLTPLSSVGNATGVTNGSESNRMLSLHEIEFVTDDAVKVESVAFAENTPDEIHVGRLTDISAVVNPSTASNPFYKISSTSDNVEILETKSESGYSYTLKGLKPGVATLRVESRENPAIATEKTIVVSEFADVTDLEIAATNLQDTINMYGETHLTSACYATLTDLLAQANELLDSKMNQDAIDMLSYNITLALNKVEFKEADQNEKISKGMSIVSATNYADTDYPENIIDGDTGTIWHSSYQSDAKLPVEVVTDLGGVYELKEVDYLARQNSHNGHVTKAIVEVSVDGETYTEVAIANFASKNGWLVDYTNYKPIRFAPTEARYVKFIALETIGDTYNKYASIAELNFYANEVEATDMSFAEETATVPVGGYVKSVLNFDPITAHPDVTYESDDPEEYVTVDENGVISVSKDAPDAYLGFDTTITATATKEDGTVLTADMKVHIVKVEKKHLANALETAKTFAEDTTIHPIIVEMLNKAIDEGVIVYDNVNATDAEVKEAYTNLQFAISCADFKAPVVKKLEALIKQSSVIALNKYDPAGQVEFKEALAKAKDIYDSIDSELILQDEVDTAYAELAAARSALIYLNTSEMSSLISTADGIMEDIESYADGDAKTAFTNAYNAAKALYTEILAQMETADATPVITMQSIIDANSALNDSMMDLRKKPSKELKDKITSLVDHINAMSMEDYNPVQLAAVKAESAVLMNMLNNAYITAEDAQEKFNHVLDMVNALENNVPVTPENPDDNGNVSTPTEPTPEETAKPDTPTDKDSATTPTTNNKTTNKTTSKTSGTTKPATGDATSVGGLFGLIGMSGAAAWFVSKKRKNKK